MSFSPRQKVFVHETGCFINVHILNETIKAAKQSKGLVAIQLDVAKAFNTVSHAAIEADIERLELPTGVRESNKNSYESPNYHYGVCWIENRSLDTERSQARGPLSPFIFNAIVDPLLEQLEQMK